MDDEPPFVAVLMSKRNKRSPTCQGVFARTRSSCCSSRAPPSSSSRCTFARIRTIGNGPWNFQSQKPIGPTATHTSIHAMIDRLLKAELIVGFNLVGFDWLLMRKYFSTTKCITSA